MVGIGDLDSQLNVLLGDATTEMDVARKNRVFCNRNLRMDTIEMIGFDMDYTLALYHQDRLERLSIELTLGKLVEKHGYPDAIRGLHYDPRWAIRGVMVDRQLGNVLTGTATWGAVTTASASSRPMSARRLTETRRSICRTIASSGSTRCSAYPRR
jgi:hypothetical protein